MHAYMNCEVMFFGIKFVNGFPLFLNGIKQAIIDAASYVPPPPSEEKKKKIAKL